MEVSHSLAVVKSTAYAPSKQLLEQLLLKLPDEKGINTDKKDAYIRTLKEIDWVLGKLDPQFPGQVERQMTNFKQLLTEFDNQVKGLSKGSAFFCGSNTTPKQVDAAFKRVLSYEQMFAAIGTYQTVLKTAALTNTQRPSSRQGDLAKEKDLNKAQSQVEPRPSTASDGALPQPNYNNVMTIYGQSKIINLLIAISLCPNGYIAKQLLKEIPNTEWIYGILHEEGTIVDKDVQKAIMYYEAARRKGHPEAFYRLGSLNERGQYGQPFEYLRMWDEAAKQGHLEAITDLGFLYENGLEDDNGKVVIAPNSDKAYSYYLQASEKNFPRALNNLATFYFRNEKYKDSMKCLEYFERATEAEYVKSLHNLGIIYYDGALVKKDEVKSRKFIKRAADKGDIQAKLVHVETVLNNGSGATEDSLIQANRFCRQVIAKDEENAEAYYYLGLMYEEGYGVNKAPKTAFMYYDLACSLGASPAAFLRLGQCYKNGFGTERDSKEAINKFAKAAQGTAEAFVYLGELYERGAEDLKQDFQIAYGYYKRAVEARIPAGYTHLGNMYKNGRYVQKNLAKAEQYFEQARIEEGKKLNSSRLGASGDLIQSSYFRPRNQDASRGPHNHISLGGKMNQVMAAQSSYSGRPSTKGTSDKAILPLTLHQLKNILGDGSIFEGQTYSVVSIVARLINFTRKTNAHQFEFCDGTQTLMAQLNVRNAQMPAFLTGITFDEKEGDYFFVVLKPNINDNNQRKYEILMIRQVENYNQVTKHLSEVALSSLQRKLL